MRSSALSRGRQLGRLCEACKRQQQQQRNLSTTSSSWASVPRQVPRESARRTITSCAQYAPRWMSTSTPSRSTAGSTTPATDTTETPAHRPSPASSEVPQTHYDFFPQTLPSGPPPAGPFAVDARALRREFLQLQAKAHPDLHPPGLKARAEATSARINEAFRTLLSPLHRAQYLLSLYGLDLAGDETAKVDDPDLLVEVLEAREEIEEAVEEGDLEGLRRRNEERERGSVEVLARCFAEGDLDGAARECVRLRYWVNVRESLDGWEKGKPIVLEH